MSSVEVAVICTSLSGLTAEGQLRARQATRYNAMIPATDEDVLLKRRGRTLVQ